jgi:L-proline 3-hydroxylase, C-terminal/Aspartyl/Asparaginyl beta-hydroxylase
VSTVSRTQESAVHSLSTKSSTEEFPMYSGIVGTVKLDDALLEKEVSRILQLGRVYEDYSEYRFGTWQHYVLWNGTGRQADSVVRGVDGGALRTELGVQFEYLNSVIEENFYTDKIKMVRANLLRDALLIPHRDYVEFKEDSARLARVHIPIKTHPEALHSENAHVFHMRKGEIWTLCVDHVHSACNPSEVPRLSIVIDVCPDGAPLESVLRHPLNGDSNVQPMLIEREGIDDDFLEGVWALRHTMNEANYKDIVMFLARIHFYKDVDSSCFFDWLIEISRGSGNTALLEKSIRYKNYLIARRELDERFPL